MKLQQTYTLRGDDTLQRWAGDYVLGEEHGGFAVESTTDVQHVRFESSKARYSTGGSGRAVADKRVVASMKHLHRKGFRGGITCGGPLLLALTPQLADPHPHSICRDFGG